MRFAVIILFLTVTVALAKDAKPLNLAMNVSISNEHVFINNAKTFIGFTPVSSAGACTPSYQCMGLLCGITASTCGSTPPTGNTGQCIGILCGVTYAN